ncbi:MAG TPA: LamG-like jellyroll fold domain-containing protein [Kofleriaceae bacterium]|nr:LamG-like jellyroll fold domain-containing protein [Kofleriaceae bacterium]
MATANALSLTGSGNALRISSIAGLAGKLTLEAWIRPTSTDRRAVLAVGDSGCYLTLAAGGGEVAAMLAVDVKSVYGRMFGVLGGTATSHAQVLCNGGSGAVRPNEWAHVAATFSLASGALSVAVFHQGKQVGTATIREPGAQLVYYQLAQTLLHSHLLEACTLGAGVPTVHGFAGAIAEARVWSDALAAADLAARRITRARGDEPNLVGCYRLERIAAGCVHDLSPRRGFGVAGADATIAAAVGLPLPPTVSADQLCVLGRGKLGKEWITTITPAHDVRITGIVAGGGFTQHVPEQVSHTQVHVFDATLEVNTPDGRSRADSTLEVRIDQAMDQLVDDGHANKQVPWQPGTSYHVPLPGSGRVRLRFLAGDLACPLIRVRTDGMPEGLWNAVRPDAAVHDQLRSMSATDLIKPADGRPSPLPGGTSTDDAAALAETLSALGRALPPAPASRTAVQLHRATGPGPQLRLSWGDVEGGLEDGYDGAKGVVDEGIDAGKDAYDDGKDAVVAGTGQVVKTITDSSGKAVQVLVATGQDGVKGASRATRSAGQLVARSGAALDDLKRKTAAAPAQLGGSAIQAFIDTADQLAVVSSAGADQIARSLQVIGTTIVNGATVAWRVVVAGVGDAIAAVGAVIRRIGAEIEKFIDYLAYLFRWQDFLAASDRFMASFETSLGKLTPYVAKLFDSQAELVKRLTASFDTGVASKSIAQLCGVNVTSNSPGIDELEYVLDHLNRVVTSAELTVEKAAARVSPALADASKAAMDGQADSTMRGLGVDKLEDGLALFTSPVSQLLGGAAGAQASSTSIIDYAFQSLRDHAEDAVSTVNDALHQRLYVPYLTPMIEDVILGKRQLTILRIVSLIAGIGSVLAAKITDTVEHGSIDTRAAFAVQPRNDAAAPSSPPKDSAWAIMGCGVGATALMIAQTAIEISQIGKTPSGPLEVVMSMLSAGIGGLTLLRAQKQAEVLSYTAAAMRPYAEALDVFEAVSGGWMVMSAWLRTCNTMTKETLDKVDIVVLFLVALADLGVTIAALASGSVQGDANVGEFSARVIATFSGAVMRLWSAVDNTKASLKKATYWLAGANFVIELGEAGYGFKQDAPV